MKYFIFKSSINTESSVRHPTKYLLGSTARDKDKHLGSILASDLVRVKVWNVSNAEASDLWFKCQFLEVKREKDELILTSRAKVCTFMVHCFVTLLMKFYFILTYSFSNTVIMMFLWGSTNHCYIK